jgi:hypothetical protein
MIYFCAFLRGADEMSEAAGRVCLLAFLTAEVAQRTRIKFGFGCALKMVEFRSDEQWSSVSPDAYEAQIEFRCFSKKFRLTNRNWYMA